MRANASVCGLWIRIIAVIQNAQLHIAEQSFHRIVIRAGLGQTEPVDFQTTHGSTRFTRLARMGTVLIQDDLDFLGGIPASYTLHETTNML